MSAGLQVQEVLVEGVRIKEQPGFFQRQSFKTRIFRFNADNLIGYVSIGKNLGFPIGIVSKIRIFWLNADTLISCVRIGKESGFSLRQSFKNPNVLAQCGCSYLLVGADVEFLDFAVRFN